MSQPQGTQPPSPSEEAPSRADLQHAAEMADLVAHEINNLLNNILLHGAVLERKAGEAVRTELNVIRQAGARAGALINRWQQINPRRPPRLGPLDLNRATAEAIASWEKSAAGPRVPVRFEPAAALPPVLADPADLDCLVRLLLANAAAATQQGTITVRTEQRPAEVLLRVEDTGAGIDPAMAERVFEPFAVARPSPAVSDVGPAPELGLALCKKLARRQQGNIQAENRPDGGVVVEVRLRPART